MATRDALTVTRTVAGSPRAFAIDDPRGKLAWRGALPGASTFDAAAHALRALQADGAAAIDLLPLALPTSWMVNAKATSRAMQRWLAPRSRAAWSIVLEGLAFDLAPAAWAEIPAEERAAIGAAVSALADGADGATLAAVTKVLALLRPQLVPLMDDAALWFALELVPEPTTADAPAAGASAFVPMLDWFTAQVHANEAPLVAVAAEHAPAVLDAAQALDRLLWVESWGHRLRPSPRSAGQR